MRIERINENSIRCVLTNFDLSVRNVKLSELTYGSETSRNLFREMMQRAASEIGFDAEDIPIMVEAIPMPNDSIMLIITKVDDPEELDTRFSRFAMTEEEETAPWNSFSPELLEGAEGLFNLPANLPLPGFAAPAGNAAPGFALPGNPPAPTESAQPAAVPNIRIYQFDHLDLVCAAARETERFFTGETMLYKNPANEKFYLLLKKGSCDELSFSKTCNLLSEYASRQKYDPAMEAYFAEHYEVFMKKDVLKILANL